MALFVIRSFFRVNRYVKTLFIEIIWFMTFGCWWFFMSILNWSGSTSPLQKKVMHSLKQISKGFNLFYESYIRILNLMYLTTDSPSPQLAVKVYTHGLPKFNYTFLKAIRIFKLYMYIDHNQEFLHWLE